MTKLINNGIKGIQIAIILFVTAFVVLGGICACNAYGNTWTVQDGKYKEVYDNREECIKTNLMTSSTEKCDDSEQVIYKDKEE